MELIVIIALIGIVAAIALPRLLDMQEEAHRSSVAATAASFREAVSHANLACVYDEYDGLDNLPGFGAGNVDFNANCYPSSTNGNNNLNINGNRCRQVWNGILSPAPSISTPANDSTDYRAQGKGTICTYTYRRDTTTQRFFTYDAATGVITETNF